jgi:hypothetical protein
MRIKDARRIETEIDNELDYTEVQKASVSTKVMAEKIGVESWAEVQDKKFELIAAKFDIRNTIAVFNQEAGINTRTAKLAELEAIKASLQNYSSNEVRTSTGFGEQIQTFRTGLSKTAIDAVRAEIRVIVRQIAKLKDTCSGINSNGTLTLKAKTVKTLTKYGLID